MPKPVRIFKLEVLCMDLNHELMDPIVEGERVPGLPFAKVMSVVERQTQWSDDHPLNNKETYRSCYDALFGNSEARQLATRIVACADRDGNTYEYGEDATKLARLVLGEKAADLPPQPLKDTFLGWTWTAHFNEVVSLIHQKKWIMVARRLTSMLNHALERARGD